MSRDVLHALLADVKDDPDDPTAWLVLCDWLEECGDESDRARAEYCRLSTRLQEKISASDFEKGERRRELFRENKERWLGPELTAMNPQMRKGLVHLRSPLRDILPRFEAAGASQREHWAWVGGVELLGSAELAREWSQAGPLFALARELRIDWYNLTQSDVTRLGSSPAAAELYRLNINCDQHCVAHLHLLAESTQLPARLRLCVQRYGHMTRTEQRRQESVRAALVERFAHVEFRQ